MALVRATCYGCGRHMQLPAERAAARAKCTYCGGEVAVDEGDAARVAEAATRISTAPPRRGKVPLECPVCLRRSLLDAAAGENRRACAYCACPLGADAGPFARAGAPLDTAEAAADVRLGEAPEFARAGSARDVLVRAGLAALVRRAAAGECDRRELARAAIRVWDAARPRGAEDVCPLEPARVADLVLREICPGMDGTASPLEIDGVVVRLTTGHHGEFGASGLGSLAAEMVLGGALGDSVSHAFAGNEAGPRRVEVRHTLQIEVRPAPGGSALSFACQIATGEIAPVERAQLAVVDRVRAGLSRAALPFAALGCVWGEWFSATHKVALVPAALEARLRALGGEIADHAPQIALTFTGA